MAEACQCLMSGWRRWSRFRKYPPRTRTWEVHLSICSHTTRLSDGGGAGAGGVNARRCRGRRVYFGRVSARYGAARLAQMSRFPLNKRRADAGSASFGHRGGGGRGGRGNGPPPPWHQSHPSPLLLLYLSRYNETVSVDTDWDREGALWRLFELDHCGLMEPHEKMGNQRKISWAGTRSIFFNRD